MIKKISITNFKSIKNALTDLPLFGAIVGKNAAGKTNFIQSINFIKNLVGYETIDKRSSSPSQLAHEIFNFNNISDNIKFSIDFGSEEEIEYNLKIEIGSNKDSNKLPAIEVVKEELYKIKNADKIKIYTRNSETLYNSENKVIPIALDSSKSAISIYNEPNVNILKNFFKNICIPELDSLNSRSTIFSNDEEDASLASLLVKLNHKDVTEFEQYKNIISKLIPDFSSIIEIPYNKNKTEKEKVYLILLEEKGLEGNLSMRSISFGDLRTMYIIAMAMIMEKGSTFIIEEIENGLHPKRLKGILSHLKTISYKKDLQILFSTHSPAVMNLFSPNEIVYISKDNNNDGTKLSILSSSDDSSHIQKILENGGEIFDYFNK